MTKFAEIPIVDVGPITKTMKFTDIHFGAKNNSDQHNQDCLNYLKWFVKHAKKEKPSHIFFLGDWFENRSQISVKTLNYSQEGARLLDSLGVPIIFIVGNHDLYLKSERKIFSTSIFQDMKNFVLVDEPMYLDNEQKWLVTPYLFKEEYPDLAASVNAAKYVLGHFEFRGFVVTGADRIMEHGPDAEHFSSPKYIFSGHFHKRQANKNVIYIGNTFPTNYGDAGESDRGYCVLDATTDEVYFIDWPLAPLYFKTRLSQILAENSDFPKNARVRCILDMDVVYSEVQLLREEMISMFGLREFSVEMDGEARKEMLTEGLEVSTDIDLSTLDNTVRQLIKEGVHASTNIDPNVLIALYEDLNV